MGSTLSPKEKKKQVTKEMELSGIVWPSGLDSHGDRLHCALAECDFWPWLSRLFGPTPRQRGFCASLQLFYHTIPKSLHTALHFNENKDNIILDKHPQRCEDEFSSGERRKYKMASYRKGINYIAQRKGTMKKEELKRILDLHAEWLRNSNQGSRAVLRGADLRGAVLSRADLSGADLSRADLSGADLSGADLRGVKIKSLRVYTGLYPYEIWSCVSIDNVPYIRMGCLYKTVEEWDRITIRSSNLSEFPNNGSEKSEERVRAFEFARTQVLIDAEK